MIGADMTHLDYILPLTGGDRENDRTDPPAGTPSAITVDLSLSACVTITLSGNQIVSGAIGPNLGALRISPRCCRGHLSLPRRHTPQCGHSLDPANFPIPIIDVSPQPKTACQ